MTTRPMMLTAIRMIMLVNVIVAMIMLPWIQDMQAMGVTPRILADDLLVIAHGPAHVVKAEEAIDRTHQMLQEMGAMVSPTKSYNFSSDEAMRRWLKEHKWRMLGTKIPVVHDMRDLGAHLVAAGTMIAPTTTGRLNP